MTVGLVVEDVSVTVAGRTLVSAWSTHVAPGSALAIVGPAGSGKSTVLDAIAGRDGARGTSSDRTTPRSRGTRAERGTPTSPPRLTGRVRLDGSTPDPGSVGIVTQQHDLLGGLSAAENVAVRLLGTEGQRGVDDADWTGVEQLLGHLGLPESSWHNLVEQLSGGQQQRVAVARALAGSPRLLCLDGPTSELDAASRDVVWSALERAMAGGAVVVIAAPDPVLVERCAQVVTLG